MTEPHPSLTGRLDGSTRISAAMARPPLFDSFHDLWTIRSEM
ncbi:hypothetical protein [Nocardioides sp. SLBN-35]|nr:hypothetical protein [Nocardioides sp. SLBN-35]TQK72039.1 hypothetical protein FBY23_3846 [Nocardioides sp. SLBN-35]